MKDLTIHSLILSNSFPTLVKAEDDIPCKRSTVKSTFTPSIHTNQQLECITLVQWTSARISRLTTFKVTRFSSSFSISACESISTWATLKMFRKVNPAEVAYKVVSSCFHHSFMLLLQLWHYPACKTTKQQHTP